MDDEVCTGDVIILNYTSFNINSNSLQSTDNIYANKYFQYKKQPKSKQKKPVVPNCINILEDFKQLMTLNKLC